MATREERDAARAERQEEREGRREARAEGRGALRRALRGGRRWRGRTTPHEEALVARELSNTEFDAGDIVTMPGNPEPCFQCGLPAETVSLTFEARLHARCADAAWAAYFRALRS